MDIARACLVGQKCRYDGQASELEHVKKLYEQDKVIPVCPEILAGLPAPRSPCEIVNGQGVDVISGNAKVEDNDGIDYSAEFIAGANLTLGIAESVGAKRAYLKSKSPSCGCTNIYDGSFSGNLRLGDGVTAALLKQNGIKCIEV